MRKLLPAGRSQSFNNGSFSSPVSNRSFSFLSPRRSNGSGTSRKDKKEMRDRCAELDEDRQKRNQQVLEKKREVTRGVTRNTSNSSTQSFLTARSAGSKAKKRYSTNVDTLHLQIDKLKAKIKLLEDERNSEKTQLMHFHRVVHALQHIPTPKTPTPESALLASLQNIKPPGSPVEKPKVLVSEQSIDMQNGARSSSTHSSLSFLDDASQQTEEGEDGEDNDPTGTALIAALQAMRRQVESLEEAHQKLLVTTEEQEEKIAALQQENELKDAKIKICEQWIRDNQDAKNEAASEKLESPVSSGRSRALDAYQFTQLMRSPGAVVKPPFRAPARSNTVRPPISEARLAEPQTPNSVVRQGVQRMRSFSRPDPNDLVASPSPRSVRRMKVIIGPNKSHASYNGPVNEKNQPHGFGTLRFANGDTYLGDLENGEMHGKGNLYVIRDGEKIVERGVFEHNAFVGEQVVETPLGPSMEDTKTLADVPLSPITDSPSRGNVSSYAHSPSNNRNNSSSMMSSSIPAPPMSSPRTPVAKVPLSPSIDDGMPLSGGSSRRTGWLERQISPTGKARLNRSLRNIKGHFSFSS
jgi:hypothetical protein